MNLMGSKLRISKQIVPIIQKYIDDNNIYYYMEPFCGGLNIIDKIKCDRKFAYDLNKYLIYLFIHVKESGKLPDSISKNLYDSARKAWHENNKDGMFANWQIGCIGWLCSFSGRGFDGGYSYEGYETRKDGTQILRHYCQERKNNLLKQFEQPLCKDIMFGISDYRDLKDIKGYCIYSDPPYANTKQFANSTTFNHDEFWNIMRKWSKDNIVLISELHAPDDFECIWSQEVSRSINVQNKTKAVEKLFKWKGE